MKSKMKRYVRQGLEGPKCSSFPMMYGMLHPSGIRVHSPTLKFYGLLHLGFLWDSIT